MTGLNPPNCRCRHFTMDGPHSRQMTGGVPWPKWLGKTHDVENRQGDKQRLRIVPAALQAGIWVVNEWLIFARSLWRKHEKLLWDTCVAVGIWCYLLFSILWVWLDRGEQRICVTFLPSAGLPSGGNEKALRGKVVFFWNCRNLGGYLDPTRSGEEHIVLSVGRVCVYIYI